MPAWISSRCIVALSSDHLETSAGLIRRTACFRDQRWMGSKRGSYCERSRMARNDFSPLYKAVIDSSRLSGVICHKVNPCSWQAWSIIWTKSISYSQYQGRQRSKCIESIIREVMNKKMDAGHASIFWKLWFSSDIYG